MIILKWCKNVADIFENENSSVLSPEDIHLIEHALNDDGESISQLVEPSKKLDESRRDELEQDALEIGINDSLCVSLEMEVIKSESRLDDDAKGTVWKNFNLKNSWKARSF